MDQSEIDEVLNEADWASDHIATSKDDIEEVFNFLSMLKDRREYTIWQKSHGKKPSDFKSTLVDQEFEKFSNKKRK
jgi:hypothetical protein